MALLAELTHRCPLRCPYCSNPLELTGASNELTTGDWQHVLDQAAAIGVLQVHFSGGEPLVRRDLPDLVRHAARLGLYTNLITSGIQLDQAALEGLIEAGIDHIQLSFQDADAASAERIGGLPGAQTRKLHAAQLIRAAGLPLTLNFVVHRQNLTRLPAMLALAERLGAARVEIAHTQYYGWGLLNRDALLPSAAALDLATEHVDAARVRTRGHMLIDYVTPDYHATRPKPCMGGWARRFLIVSPNGTALPCHAAATIPGMTFPSVRQHTLAAIWQHDPGFQRFRGTAWLPQLCQSCDHRDQDWGGCRCQALALAGDVTEIDPVCQWSPGHGVVADALAAAAIASNTFVYRSAKHPAAAA
jgi:pyrroloquinoline quinone biosynthesis protein E